MIDIWGGLFFFFFKICLFLEEEREKGSEIHQCMVASFAAPVGSCWGPQPRLHPDWESNWPPFGSQPALNPLSHTSQGWLFYFQFSSEMYKK